VPSLLQAIAFARRFGGEPLIEIGGPVHAVRQRIAERFLTSDATHLLTMDDDVVAPGDGPERLLAIDAAVATGVYPLSLNGHLRSSAAPLGMTDWPVVPPDAIFEAGSIGLGFALIRRDAFDGLRTPWFLFGASSQGQPVGEDVWFASGVRRAGHRVMCDGRLRCSHIKGDIDLLALAGWPDGAGASRRTA
jgi:hypothetical protein